MKRNRIINWRAVGWMLLFVAVLSSCRDDDAGTPQAKMRTISLNFPAIQPYTASRAENVDAITGESTFHTADIWVFDNSATDESAIAAAYKHIEDAERYTTNSGELRTELTIPEEITTVDIYVITNNSSVEELDANSTRSELKAATFNEKPENNTSGDLASKGLLMSRIIKDIPVADLSGGYDANAQLPLERGVAKIACFFAKESESTNVEITGITVSGAINQGSVFPVAVTYTDKDTRPNSANVPTGAGTLDTDIHLLNETPLTINAVLENGQTLVRGENETAQGYITRLTEIIGANHTNDYYLFEADANAMMTVTINYTLDGRDGKKPIALQEEDIIRNHYIVITGTVEGASIQINLTYSVASWKEEDIVPPTFE